VKIVQEDDQYSFIKEYKKVRKIPIGLVQDLDAIVSRLNNAFYLDSYFKMADWLNKRYPLNYHSFREGFYTWEKLDNKEPKKEIKSLYNFVDNSIKWTKTYG